MESRGLIVGACIALLLSCGLGVWAQDHNVPFRPRAAAGGDVLLSDSFDRADNEDVSVSAPFSYLEDTASANCDWQITGNDLRYESNHSTECDHSYNVARAESDFNGVNHWVLAQYGGATNCTTCRPTLIFRTQSGAGLGSHYALRCNDDDCNAVRWQRWEGQTFGEAITIDSQCDGTGETNTTIVAGDWVGGRVSGTGTGTTMEFFDFGASFPGTDDTTWGSADCTFTDNPTTAVDTGTRAGLGAQPGGVGTVSRMDWEQWHAGDNG